jgi:hypothetical protein
MTGRSLAAWSVTCRAAGNDLGGGMGIALSERTRSMADDEQSTSGMVSGLVQDFIAQLRAATEGLEDLAGFGARRPLAPGTFPLPGALSAAQLTAISGSVAAQRRNIEALKAQLSSFDEQLSVLEQILSPLTEWSRTWADLEERLLKMSRGPAAENPDSSLRLG